MDSSIDGIVNVRCISANSLSTVCLSFGIFFSLQVLVLGPLRCSVLFAFWILQYLGDPFFLGLNGWFLHLFTVVEVESPLRHKAKSEREQRTAERAVYSNVLLYPLLCPYHLAYVSFHRYWFLGKSAC